MIPPNTLSDNMNILAIDLGTFNSMVKFSCSMKPYCLLRKLGSVIGLFVNDDKSQCPAVACQGERTPVMYDNNQSVASGIGNAVTSPQPPLDRTLLVYPKETVHASKVRFVLQSQNKTNPRLLVVTLPAYNQVNRLEGQQSSTTKH